MTEEQEIKFYCDELQAYAMERDMAWSRAKANIARMADMTTHKLLVQRCAKSPISLLTIPTEPGYVYRDPPMNAGLKHQWDLVRAVDGLSKFMGWRTVLYQTGECLYPRREWSP